MMILENESLDAFVSLLPLKFPQLIFIKGELGAGKTTLTKAICKFLGCKEHITSPTFNILNIYEDKIYHYDLYRLKDLSEIYEIGIEEAIGRKYVIVEWPEIISKTFTPDILIKIEIASNSTRIFSFDLI